MIIPTWFAVVVISVIMIFFVVTLIKLHMSPTANLKFEDFFTSTTAQGDRSANPHKLAFLAAFIVCAWINVIIAPHIPESNNALYYSIAFMVVFTISVLSRSTLTVLRDIISIIWRQPTKKDE